MKNKQTQILLIGLFIITTLSCKKEPTKPTNPLNGRTTAVFNPDKNYGTVYDVEGNEYKTIVIGNQTWMAENLRTTKYRNGELIPNVKDNDTWNTLTFDAYCNYNNTENLDTIATFGRLYNWYAASNSKNIAPEGWRVPTITDWAILFDYIGGKEIAGNNMKEIGKTHWEDAFKSTNSCGFTAIPSGDRFPPYNFSSIGYFGTFWTSSEYSSEKAGFLFLYCLKTDVSTGVNYKYYGYAIRCIKE